MGWLHFENPQFNNRNVKIKVKVKDRSGKPAMVIYEDMNGECIRYYREDFWHSLTMIWPKDYLLDYPFEYVEE